VRDFLEQMATSSAARVARARAREPERELRHRCADLPAAPPLARSAAGFDLIAEVKRRSPSGGVLARPAGGAALADVPAEAVAQA
jgi:indole-3-glycerol phosphate synthase